MSSLCTPSASRDQRVHHVSVTYVVVPYPVPTPSHCIEAITASQPSPHPPPPRDTRVPPHISPPGSHLPPRAREPGGIPPAPTSARAGQASRKAHTPHTDVQSTAPPSRRRSGSLLDYPRQPARTLPSFLPARKQPVHLLLRVRARTCTRACVTPSCQARPADFAFRAHG